MVSAVDDLDLEDQDGGALRRKLEKALKDNKALTEAVHGYRVKEILAAGGADLVRPEDLVGVPTDELEERAKTLQVEKTTQAQEMLRTALKDRGLDDEAVEAFLKQEAKSDQVDEQRQAEERARVVRTIAGTQTKPTDVEGLDGLAAIRAHFASKK